MSPLKRLNVFILVLFVEMAERESALGGLLDTKDFSALPNSSVTPGGRAEFKP